MRSVCKTLKPALLLLLITVPVLAQQKKALTLHDLMTFTSFKDIEISPDGAWLAASAWPDRGDGELIVRAIEGTRRFTIERGKKPVFSPANDWLAASVPAPAELLEKKKKDKPKSGVTLLDLGSGSQRHFEKTEKYVFSPDGAWLALHAFLPKKKKGKKSGSEADSSAEKRTINPGALLRLLRLADSTEFEIPFVRSFAFDSTSRYFAYSIADSTGEGNGVYLRRLSAPETARKLSGSTHGHYSALSWGRAAGALAWIASVEDEKGKPGAGSLHIWHPGRQREILRITDADTPAGWYLPARNKLTWSLDGKRLFLGLRPDKDLQKQPEKKEQADFLDLSAIRENAGVDVWHWNDPLINPNQKKTWKKNQEKTWLAVVHLKDKKLVQLADSTVPDVRVPDNSHTALGLSDIPWQKYITWEGWFYDVYSIDLKKGTRHKVATRVSRQPVYLSPGGRFIVYYQDKNWHLYSVKKRTSRTLTDKLPVPFYNEDHDYPMQVPGYGIAGWLADDAAVLIYDKFDIWSFDTATGAASNLTAGYGREHSLSFRVQKLDTGKKAFARGENLLLHAFDNNSKESAIFTVTADKPGVRQVFAPGRKLRVKKKARNNARILFTLESYAEFPDIWSTDAAFADQPRRLTELHPELSDYAWGSAELVSWNSLDGRPMQGVLIKPGNYQQGKKYPVIVYFYRFFSQRVHEFNQMAINHRPNFPYYASNGYAIFLPDIRFEVGRPGFAATKSLVPGVQKIIDMGIADPEAIGLHGHSWSGYQTAFIITQTDIFACAIAGAPVSNMTSAYGGIRWGTGLARQFQYEKTQSRIGASLWEGLDKYIENSPLFYADRINTPLLIMFGDEDGAVPWYQGIELYLAMRRLGKESVFLQYRGEPHHPRKYPNKLDYTIRMKEYFDHYLKGTPAPEWISTGVPYSGK